MDRQRTFVGFGFGAIQSGLFVYEAFRCGAFERLVVAEVVPEVVRSVRETGGVFGLNIAHKDRIESVKIGPIQIEDPNQEEDRKRLVNAIAEAREIATALPSVDFYGQGTHRILAEGLSKKVSIAGPPALVYAAENDNRAAQILESCVFGQIPEGLRESVRSKVRFLNTVIGKMSGVICEDDENWSKELLPITPGASRAFLVEAFNHILISSVDSDKSAEGSSFHRGIDVFEEKADLNPFQEAKLYGHNATHALAAYIGALIGAQRISDLADVPAVMDFLREAFIEESGQALIRKHSGTDALFTSDGYREFAEDLLQRMTNPYLGDAVERVARDPQRKLGWDDRLVGTMRMAIQQGVIPRRYARGAAAALIAVYPNALEEKSHVESLLEPIWQDKPARDEERKKVAELMQTELECLRKNYSSNTRNDWPLL